MDSDANALSLWDSEGSTDDHGNKSFNAEFNSLHLNSSLDSKRSGRSNKISKAKTTVIKSNLANQTRPKSKSTSTFVLKVLNNCESSTPSPGYFSISPTSENEISQTNSVETPNMFLNNMVGEDHLRSPKINSNVKEIIKRYAMDKLMNRSRKPYIGQWIFDHGDTQLIKSCRCGQIQAVKESLKLLRDHQQTRLIDHQNMSNQTALSIATNSMNEILIELLLVNGASPDIPLSMGNNVLHIAAAMTSDVERKTYMYLIRGIMGCGNTDKLLDAINGKNIFDFDPIQVLVFYRNANETDRFCHSCLQRHIDYSIDIKRLYDRSY